VDVAHAAGVSVATVSNAFNNVRYVNAETKRRVTTVAAKLGYTPNIHARRMRSTGIGTIGLFSSMPFAISGQASQLGFLMEIAGAAAVRALESGFALLLVPPTASAAPPFEELAIDAALIVEPSADDVYVAQLRQRGIPFVTIGRQLAAPAGVASIDIRSKETAQLLLDHLAATSSRSIALMVGTSKRNSYVETEAAYLAFAAARGIEAIIVRIDETGGEHAAYVATLELMRERPRIQGILAIVDTFAAGTLRALAELGISVPDTVRVATRHDGHRARESSPPLTAVDLHLEDVAVSAVNLLLKRIETGRSAAQTILAPLPALVARASTA
jgi:DNA-binding LacI/PurR family transcriptional regulator